MTQYNWHLTAGLLGKSVKLAFPIILCSGLAACGVSQITEPFQSGGLFGGGEEEKTPSAQSNLAAIADADQARNATLVTGSTGKLSCPKFKIAPGGHSITFHAPGSTQDSLAVMHHGEIQKTARECARSANGLRIKYGFSGRVLLGPKGRAGSITLPAKVIVQGASGPVKTANVRVVVNIPAGQTAGTFSEVREIEVPVLPGARYRLDVAFDKGKTR